MFQGRESGAKANSYGHKYGDKIIEAIGAKKIGRGSNECSLGGELLSVHCAHKKTLSIGVTYKALEKVSAVLGAFEQDDASYVIWKMPTDRYKELMTETRSKGPSRGRVGIVKRVEFERYGTRFAQLRLSDD